MGQRRLPSRRSRTEQKPNHTRGHHYGRLYVGHNPFPSLPFPFLPFPSLSPLSINPPKLTVAGTEFLALSLRSEGYTVVANTEASGTFSRRLASDANRRMENAGVILQGFFAIVMDLMRDWRNTPGSAQLLPFLDRYLPVYGYVARAHEAAVLNGTVIPGEAGL